MTCKDCLHWIAPYATKYVVLNPLAGECRSGAVVIGEPRSRVYVDDGTRYPSLPTGPDFGCVHFEAKKP